MSAEDKPEFDQAVIATLSAEERAALEEVEDDPEAPAPSDDDAGDPDETLDEHGNPVNTEPADDAAVVAAAAEPAAEVDETTPEPDVVVYKASLPDDYDQRVKDLRESESELQRQFREGEIDFDEYLGKGAELRGRQEELSAIKLKADIAAEMGQQTMEQQWESAQRRFSGAVKSVIDYSDDEAKQGDLNLFVSRLANDPANHDKSFEWFLTEGHKRVIALHGIVADRPRYPAKNEKPDRAPAIRNLPQSLAHVDGGTGPGDVGGEFDNLDNLSGQAYEDALAAMKRKDPKAYARYTGN